MIARENLIEWLNSIRWRTKDNISREARDLIVDYVDRVNPVVRAPTERDGANHEYAHTLIEGVGQAIPCGLELFEEMNEKVKFINAPVATPMMFSITAAYCWEADPRTNALPNPWPPLMDLLGLGHTITFGTDEETDSGVVLRVGYNNNGLETFRVL